MMAHSKQASLRYLIFGAVVAVTLLWAFTTGHVWEDYYITYRSSKNLVTGHGLVFNPGDRLHTFTSPLGVLLPAAACYLTGTSSDTAAIWVFRVWSACAFAGAVVLLVAIARRYRYGLAATLLLAALVAWDGKSIDFSSNGMETGFLLLFVAYTLWAMFACEGRRWLHLGLAWAGLMWTRPDSFLYVGLLAAGVFFFNDAERTGRTRGQWLKLFFQAGLVCTALYLPWIEWTWWYYGTPVPHTITAKSGVGGHSLGWGTLKTLVDFPRTVWGGTTSLEGTYLPSYYQAGGWPKAMVTAARGLALFLAFQWVIPWWRVEVRVASFAFCGLHVYLTYFPFFPFPWYLPGTTLLAAVTLGGMIAQLLAVAEGRATPPGQTGRWRGLKIAALALGLVVIGGQVWLTWEMRREMKLEQIYSATGTRRALGDWLKANAKPGDTVFTEPLGHIGYFSGLKTYDFPGLSSREMVEAIRDVGTDWARLIDYLSPDWVVLRPAEYERVRKSVPILFGPGRAYDLAKEFNRLPEVQHLDVYGRKYIEFDSHLLLFRRQQPRRYLVNPTGLFPFEGLGLSITEIRGQRMYMLHATGLMSMTVPSNAKGFWITYAMPDASYTGDSKTDGVEFIIVWSNGHKQQRLLTRLLNPAVVAIDRGVQTFHTRLPPYEDGARIILMTIAGPSDSMDWSCWGTPDFVP